MNTEMWKPVPRFAGLYEVSNLGRIRSLDRSYMMTNVFSPVIFKRTWRGRIMKLKPDKNGYLRFDACVSDVNKTLSVAACVCEAFNGPKPKGKQINHKDGKVANNVPTNLEWVTNSENMLHQKRVLGHGRGEDHPASKVTEDAVRLIRAAKNEGWSLSFLAERYNINQATVSNICRRKTWRHVA